MRHPDEGTIHAWLDGALPSEEGARLAAHLAECPACAEAVAEARGLVAASSRILGLLDAVPKVVVPAQVDSAPSRRFVRRRWWTSSGVRAAAALLFVTGVSVVVLGRSSELELRSVNLAGNVDRTATATEHFSDIGSAEALSDGSSEWATRDAGAAGEGDPSGRVRASGQAAAAPPPAPAPVPAVAGVRPRSDVERRAAMDESRAVTEFRAVPDAPDTSRIQPPEVALTGIAVEPDSLAGRVAASNIERSRAERVGEANPPTRDAIRLGETPVVSRRAPAAAVVAEADRVHVAPAPSTPPAPAEVAIAPGKVAGDDSLRVSLVLVGERVDSTAIGVFRTAVYRVRPGIEVTHGTVERRFRAAGGQAEGAAGRADTTPGREGERTLLRMDLGRVQAVHWTDASGVYHSLSGPVEQEELERIREALAAQRPPKP